MDRIFVTPRLTGFEGPWYVFVEDFSSRLNRLATPVSRRGDSSRPPEGQYFLRPRAGFRHHDSALEHSDMEGQFSDSDFLHRTLAVYLQFRSLR